MTEGFNVIQRTSGARRRQNDDGFTLVELLVVIIILGVLSGVVVFAVRGVGDKGKADAVSIDERTIRTAQESYCANEGRYGSLDELVAARLLSARPTLNGVMVDSPGPCGSTGYQIFPTELPAVTGLNGTTCKAGAWCTGPSADGTSSTSVNRNIAPVFGPTNMVQLASGKILVKKATTTLAGTGGCCTLPFQIYDPAAGPVGSWSPVPPPTTRDASTPAGSVPNYMSNGGGGGTGVDTMRLIKGSSCGSHCGKVLVHIRQDRFGGADSPKPETGAAWVLYDPNTPASPGSLGSWQDLSTATPASGGPYRRTYFQDAVQLTRAPCGNMCGKFLIVGQGHESLNYDENTPANPEVWDPAANPVGSFRKLGLTSGYQEDKNFPEGCGAETPNKPACLANGFQMFWSSPTLTLLNDGRVLMLTGRSAQLFDPVTEKFTTVASPTPYRHSWSYDKAAMLPDGGVLATTNKSNSTSAPEPSMKIFRPGPGAGGGSWEPVATCGDLTTTNKYCHLITTLADGRVLARRGTSFNAHGISPSQPSQPPQIFNPVTKTWSPAAAPTPVTSAGDGILLRETNAGSCGSLCNRVITGNAAATGATGAVTSVFTP